MSEEEELQAKQEREIKEIDRIVKLVQKRAEKLKNIILNNPKSIIVYSRAFNKFWGMFNYDKIGRGEENEYFN